MPFEKGHGDLLPPEARARQAAKMRGKKFPNRILNPFWKGKTMPLELRRKFSLAHGGTGNPVGKRHSVEEKQWKKDIIRRDNFTCRHCHKRGGRLQAHHAKSWAKYPDLRFELDNGITLCIPCHELTDNYKGRMHGSYKVSPPPPANRGDDN